MKGGLTQDYTVRLSLYTYESRVPFKNDKSPIPSTRGPNFLYIWTPASAVMWINVLTLRKYEKAWKGPQGRKEEGGGVRCSQKH